MRCIFWVALFAGCPGTHVDPSHHAGSDAPIDAAQAPGPTERDCRDQFAHAVDLEVTAMRTAKPEQGPTADEIRTLENELRDRYLPSCRAGTLDGHHCAMAATTLAELGSCHATPSSSTSNKSVAPPGMSAPAPRSP